MPTTRCRNKAIENWAKFKEDYHIRFRFTPRRILDIGLWAFAVPLFGYYVIKNNQVRDACGVWRVARGVCACKARRKAQRRAFLGPCLPL